MYEGWFITEAIISFWRKAGRRTKALIISIIILILMAILLTLLYNWIVFNS